MELVTAPQEARNSKYLAPLAGHGSPWDGRPAWAQPQTSWPFRVIDPQHHRIGSQDAPAWAS